MFQLVCAAEDGSGMSTLITRLCSMAGVRLEDQVQCTLLVVYAVALHAATNTKACMSYIIAELKAIRIDWSQHTDALRSPML
jgi:hypothetical protein